VAHTGDEEVAGAIRRRIHSADYAAASADELDHAQRILEIGTTLSPESGNAWDSLAEVLLLQGDLAQSIQYYRKALEVDPGPSNAAE
jgi:tetratricopeptide (TPR) repeat protein